MINLPNFLAFIRVLLAPLFFYLLLHLDRFESIHVTWMNYFAALVFVLAAVTDFFDGYIARSWGQITKFGSIIDPLADKMLVLAGFLGLALIGRANPWIVYLILVREFFITGLRVIMASEKIEVSASISGKIKTIFQMIAIGLLSVNIFEVFYLGQITLWIAFILTVYSGIEYTVNYIKITKR